MSTKVEPRAQNSALISSVAPFALVIATFGASFGVLSVSSGIPRSAAIGMSMLVFGGAGQFAAIGVVSAGSGVAVAALSGLLVNARFMPLAMAIGDKVSRKKWQFLVLAHLVIEPTVGLALGERHPAAVRRVFVRSGVALYVAWVGGTSIGAALAGLALDPAALGLDAALPALLLGLLRPLLATPASRIAAVVGCLVAGSLMWFLPPGIPVLLSVLGAMAGLVVRRRTSRRDKDD